MTSFKSNYSSVYITLIDVGHATQFAVSHLCGVTRTEHLKNFKIAAFFLIWVQIYLPVTLDIT